MQSKSIVILVAAALLSVKCLFLLGQSPGDVRPNSETQRTEIYDGRRWVPFKGRQLTVTDLATFRVADGQKVDVFGYATPGDAGATKRVEYHASGRAGVTLGMFFLAGPGVDDYWEFEDKTVADARWAGCVADWAYPDTGTDNTQAFNDFFADIQRNAVTQVVIPPGIYRITHNGPEIQTYKFEPPSSGTQAEVVVGDVIGDYTVRAVRATFGAWGSTKQGIVVLESNTSNTAYTTPIDVDSSGGGRIRLTELVRKSVINIPSGFSLEASDARLAYYNGTGAVAIHDRDIMDFSGGFGREVIRLPDVYGHYGIIRVPFGEEKHAAVVFSGTVVDSDVHINMCARMPVGFLVAPISACGLNSYNRYHGGVFTGAKVAVEIRGDQNVGETGWANESSWYGQNFTFTSNSNNLGSMSGVKFSKTGPGAYPGGNNHRFISSCFQVNGHLASEEINIGSAPAVNARYCNRNNVLRTTEGTDVYGEYVCTAVGSGGVATAPTHTSGDVVDSNGYGFTYCGEYWKVNVHHSEGCGSQSKFEGARWEGGDGPFALIERDANYSVSKNSYEWYGAGNPGNTRQSPSILQLTGPQYIAYNTFSDNYISNRYGRDPNQTTAVTRLDKLGIRSAAGWTFAGMSWQDYFVAGNWLTRDENIRLCHEALYFPNLGSQHLCVFIDPLKSGPMIVKGLAGRYAHTGDANYGGLIRFWEDDDARYQISGSQDQGFICSYGTSPNTSYDFIAPQLGNRHAWVHFDRELIKRMSYGLYVGGYWEHIAVEFSAYDGQPAPVSITDWWGDPTTDIRSRRTAGTPTVGVFSSVGEVIENVDNTSGQPVGYRVTTAGHLAPAWSTATSYVEGELVTNGGNVYAANNADTSGATAPAGTTTSDDGNITWRYIGGVASLTPSSETYP